MNDNHDKDNMPHGFNEKTGPAAFEDPHMDTPPQAESAPADMSATPSQIDALAVQNAQMKDQLMRALAEIENTRRRAQLDREDASKFAVVNFARNLLTVADNLGRALDAIPADLREQDARVQNLIAGIDATQRDLLAVFERAGVRKIPAADQVFNANLHEVIFEVPGTGRPAGTIVQVVEDGYTIHDRLLRPARVGVAKADGSASSPTHILDQEA